jgi:hypothetical protein
MQAQRSDLRRLLTIDPRHAVQQYRRSTFWEQRQSRYRRRSHRCQRGTTIGPALHIDEHLDAPSQPAQQRRSSRSSACWTLVSARPSSAGTRAAAAEALAAHLKKRQREVEDGRRTSRGSSGSRASAPGAAGRNLILRGRVRRSYRHAASRPCASCRPSVDGGRGPGSRRVPLIQDPLHSSRSRRPPAMSFPIANGPGRACGISTRNTATVARIHPSTSRIVELDFPPA